MYLLLAPYLHHTNTLAVPGLSGDYLRPPTTTVSEYPRTPELHQQSQDCPGMATQPLGPPCHSIPEHRSYTSSPGIVLGWLPSPWDLSARVSQNAGVTPAVPGLSQDGYPTPGTPLSEYPRTPELHQQSRDCPGMATQPLGPLSEYPRTPELHQQSWDCPGMATQPLGPVCQSIPERRSYTSSPGIVPG